MFKKLFGFGKKKKEEIQEESVEEIQVEEDDNSELEEAQNDSDDLKEEIEEQAEDIEVQSADEEIEEIKQLREQYPDKKKTNIIFVMGKYDFDSKYNVKNITRMLKETKEISAVPYNLGFYEASMEGKIADFFLNNRTLNDSSSSNAKFLQECKRSCDNILAKLEDLKMRM